MIWFQALTCFVLWLGVGFVMRRSSERLKHSIGSMGRPVRTVLGSLGLVLGLAVLAGGLVAIHSAGGIGNDGLLPWAWMCMALLGSVFVVLQVLGAAAMVSLVLDEVTPHPHQPSVNKEK